MSGGHLYVFFGKMSSGLLSIFKLDYFSIEFYEFFIYFRYYSLSDISFCKYHLPFRRLSFHFVDGFLPVQKLVSLMQSHLKFFYFHFPCLRRQIKIKKIYISIAKTDVKECTADVFFWEFYGFQVLHLFRDLIHFFLIWCEKMF